MTPVHHTPIRRWLATALLCGTASTLLATTSRAEIVGSYIFGISDADVLYQTDPSGKTYNAIYSTGLSSQSNALAFDRVRDQMFFMSTSGTFNSTPYTNGLFLWNKPQNTFSLLAQGSELDVPTGTLPANASFYDNAFWFFKEGTRTLVRANLSYSGSTPTGVAGFVTYTMNTGSSSPTDAENVFGDIAINPTTGTLYGYTAPSSGLFYSLDLNGANPAGGTLSNFSLINTTSGTGLQLAFNEDYSILYGHSYQGANWYEINTSSGSLTNLNFATVVPGGPANTGFRDLAGASIVSVPEPSTMALAIAGLVGGGFLARRSRRRQA